MIRGDASEFRALGAELEQAGRQALPALRGVMQTGMAEVKAAWQENARATSGAHGKHYPNSITYETRELSGSIVGEVGPDSSRLQGGMGRGFEFGSQNQPPHLDGLRAVDDKGPTFERRIDTAIGFLLP